MRSRLVWFGALAIGIGALAAGPGYGEKAQGHAEDKAAIAKQAEAFVEAFHQGDAKALAAFWTPQGDYTDLRGRRLKGREAIEKAFKRFFAENKDLKLRISSDSLRFISPDVAIEDGMSEVLTPDGAPPSRARYTNVHVKRGGKWLLSSVRDAPHTPPSNHDHLRGLEWAIGDWAGESQKGEQEQLSFAWAEPPNFVIATFATTAHDVSVGSATVWIGWDPITKHIRSWTFDAAGGFGEGAWTREGKKWTVKTHLVLQDGKKMAATYVIASVDADTISLQAKDRAIDGEKLPDTKIVKLKRVK